MKIGIFDSGIGGLSILKAAVEKLSEHQFFYIADYEFGIYGNRQIREIEERVVKITQLLVNEGCELIIVACNTATAAGIDLLRNEFNIPFVGVEPYLNILNKEKELIESSMHIGVITTEVTGKSKRFVELKHRRDPQNRIKHHICFKLAGLIENLYHRGMSEEISDQIELELKPVSELALTHLILGCTHYSLISKLIEKKLNLITISPGVAVATQASRLINLNTCHDSPVDSYNFYSTGAGIWQENKLSSLDRWPI